MKWQHTTTQPQLKMSRHMVQLGTNKVVLYLHTHYLQTQARKEGRKEGTPDDVTLRLSAAAKTSFVFTVRTVGMIDGDSVNGQDQDCLTFRPGFDSQIIGRTWAVLLDLWQFKTTTKYCDIFPSSVEIYCLPFARPFKVSMISEQR